MVSAVFVSLHLQFTMYNVTMCVCLPVSNQVGVVLGGWVHVHCSGGGGLGKCVYTEANIWLASSIPWDLETRSLTARGAHHVW